VWIFDSVEKYEKWFLASRLRPIENLLRRVVGFRGDEGNDALVVSTRHQSIEGRWRFDVNGDSLRLRQLREIGKLPVCSQ
jgi:DNA repair ATPase RecN